MNCSECKLNRENSVPYIVHESAMARAERTQKRLWITILILIVFLVGSNIAWGYYESSFEDVSTTIEADQDGSGTNIVSGGDYNGPES